MLERGDHDAEQLAAMREQIVRAERFVDDLLAYGRPRPLELRDVDLGALAGLAHSTSRQALAAAAPDHDLQLRLELEPEELSLEADQSQLLQLLVVLLDNAALAGCAELRLRGRQEGDQIHVAVEDDGPGIPDEILETAFEPFVTRGRGAGRQGTGLGLAIARGIVQRHGGEITADRSPDLGGARFRIRLPRDQRVLGAATGVS